MRMALVRNIVLILVMQSLLSACSIFSPVKTEQPMSYVLNTLPRPVTEKSVRKIALVVAQPTSNQIYNTTDMAYTTQPYQVAYFAKSRWADTPAHMLQSLLVQTLQETHYFDAVGSSPVIGHYDYVLAMQLLQFEQRFSAQGSDLVIKLRVQLIKLATNQVVKTKVFTVVESAPERTPYGGVVAANRATAKLLSGIEMFCLQSLE